MRRVVGILGGGSVGAALMGDRPRLSDLGYELVEAISPAAMAAKASVIVVEAGSADTLTMLRSARPSFHGGLTLVSAAEGLTLTRLREAAGPEPALFRVVCDLAAASGSRVTLLCVETRASGAEMDTIAELLACTGLVAVVPEDMLESAIAVMGSAMSFLALALEGIEDGAVSAGLPRDTARAFVRQTALTTALLLQNHGGSPADLKDQVASPAGTTIAGLAALEDRAVRGAFIQATKQAADSRRILSNAGRPPVIE